METNKTYKKNMKIEFYKEHQTMKIYPPKATIISKGILVISVEYEDENSRNMQIKSLLEFGIDCMNISGNKVDIYPGDTQFLAYP